jgi:hypothetical protein
MSKNVIATQSGGIGFCGLLTIIFILLKLFGLTAVASWSWIWVLCPLWIPLAIWLAVLLVGMVIALIALGIVATFGK